MDGKRIAIIGAGVVGAALGGGWAARGHELVYAARDPASGKVRRAVAATPGARAEPIGDAVAGSDVAVLATPWAACESALAAAGDFGGRPLLDATNPLTPSFGLALGFDDSGGEQVQRWAPTARVVKVFNSTGWENLARPGYPAGPAAMLLCGDDAAARGTAGALAADLGLEPLDLGPLQAARLLEPYAMVWIRLALVQGLG
ncbi:MAG: NAD(P)-binding domain-containing protein, partial [Burkholderiales bacterium]